MAQETETQQKNTTSAHTEQGAQAQASTEVGAPTAETVVQPETAFSFPSWPTSKPGPRATPAPYGSKAINRRRSEQVAELAYNQETGEKVGGENLLEQQPATPIPVASKPEQDFLKKRRKQRL